MLSPGAMEMFRQRPIPRTMSGSTALWRLGSGVVCLAPVANEGSVDSWGLACPLGPCWCLGAMLLLELCGGIWA